MKITILQDSYIPKRHENAKTVQSVIAWIILLRFKELDLVVNESSKEESGMKEKWMDLINHPTRMVILGESGMGKSVTAAYIGDLLHKEKGLPLYYFGIEKEKRILFPRWIRHFDNLEDFPERAVVIFDEAALSAPCRRSISESNVKLNEINILARQKEVSLIWASQQGSQIDRVLPESSQVIVFKKPQEFQGETERPYLRPIATRAYERFKDPKIKVPQKWNLLHTEDREDFLSNPVPSWWTNELSHIHADYVVGKIHPTRKNKDELMQIAKSLREKNLSYQRIAERLGVSKTTAYNYVNNYPYLLQEETDLAVGIKVTNEGVEDTVESSTVSFPCTPELPSGGVCLFHGKDCWLDKDRDEERISIQQTPELPEEGERHPEKRGSKSKKNIRRIHTGHRRDPPNSNPRAD